VVTKKGEDCLIATRTKPQDKKRDGFMVLKTK